jgi:hypothetical protein
MTNLLKFSSVVVAHARFTVLPRAFAVKYKILTGNTVFGHPLEQPEQEHPPAEIEPADPDILELPPPMSIEPETAIAGEDVAPVVSIVVLFPPRMLPATLSWPEPLTAKLPPFAMTISP